MNRRRALYSYCRICSEIRGRVSVYRTCTRLTWAWHPPNWRRLSVRAYADSEASFSAASGLLIRRRAAIAGMWDARGRVLASSHL